MQSDNSTKSRILFSIALGTAATLTSLFITVIAGEERGVTGPEKAAWIATGVVILLAAHFLPALAKSVRASVKILVLAVWIGAIAATTYTHATFFLNAQGRVGEQRASTIAAVPPVAEVVQGSSVRSRTQIAADVATTVRGLALIDARRCDSDCGPLVARRKALSARLDALRIEDAEAVRSQNALDAQAAAIERRHRAQDVARTDPFMAGVASFVRLKSDQVSLLMAIVLGLLVDAVAVVSWAALAHPVPRTRPHAIGEGAAPQTGVAPLPFASDAPSAASHEVQEAANEPLLRMMDGGSSDTADVSLSPTGVGGQKMDLADLAAAIRAGRAKTTLASIRSYIGCADSAAMALRRRLAEEHPELFWPSPVTKAS